MTVVSFDPPHDPMVTFDDSRDYATVFHNQKGQMQFGYEPQAINFEEDMQALDTYDYEDFDLSDSTDDWLSIAVDMDGSVKDFNEVSYVQIQPPTRKRKMQPKRQEKMKKTKVSKSKRADHTDTSFRASPMKSTTKTTVKKSSVDSKSNSKPDVSIKLSAKSKNETTLPAPLKPLNSRSTSNRSNAVKSTKNTKKEKTKGQTAKSQENDKAISRSRVKSSMYRGVSRCAKDGRWQARIRHGSKVKYLGRFKTEYEAALCYDNAAKLFHGVRATTNF